ncbi:MAG: HAD family phosphatase [Blautia sp.]
MTRNLIFDVGDVLLEYRWFEMLTEDYGLSEAEAKRIGGEMFDREIWEMGLDGGRLTTDEAIARYKERYPKDGKVIDWFLKNGRLMVINRTEIWEKIAALKKQGYGIYILSNYSEELFHMHTEGAAFLDILDGGIVSYQVHELKPDRRIYELLLEKYDLKASECLFFDDRLQNVEGARKVGIEAIQVTSRQMLNEKLEQMLQDGMKA